MQVKVVDVTSRIAESLDLRLQASNMLCRVATQDWTATMSNMIRIGELKATSTLFFLL